MRGNNETQLLSVSNSNYGIMKIPFSWFSDYITTEEGLGPKTFKLQFIFVFYFIHRLT